MAGLGRSALGGCHCEGNLEQGGQPRAATGRQSVVPWEEAPPLELGRWKGRSWAKSENQPRRRLLQSVCLSRADRYPCCTAGLRFFCPVTLSPPLLLHGAVARRSCSVLFVFTGEVSEIAARPAQPPAPLRPRATHPSAVPRPHTSAPDFASRVLGAPPSSAPPASPFLAPSGPSATLRLPRPSLAPLCSQLRKNPFFL